MKRAPRLLWIIPALLLSAGLLKATLPQTTIGSWTAAVSLSQSRSNASAVILSDGRILITGGDGGSGVLQSAELFGTNGYVSSAAAMNVPRTGHFAVVLNDGQVLVGGGNSSGGGTTNSAEIYDPSADSWTQTSPTNSARANATAALLQDGTVLIAGGDNSGVPSNTIEIFDPSSGTFSFAGTLSSPRTKHAMTMLHDGRVLIVGGSDGTNPLASSDIFDPSTRSISAGPNLATARYAHSATTLLDGRVVVIGGAGAGSNGIVDLASAEIFDPATTAFSAAGANLATARQGYQAFLLPNNNNLLIVGGSSGGTAVAASELFTTQVSAQGAWISSIATTGANVTGRADAVGSAMKQDGLLLAVGGNDASGKPLASTELYAFPTLKTDQADYPPGSIVTIMGSGWQPGETVTLTLVESPLIDTHPVLTALADGNGNIVNNQFSPDVHDVNVKFYLTAVGSQSGLQAQNAFTDATNLHSSVSLTISPVAVGPGQTLNWSASATCVDQGGTNCSSFGYTNSGPVENGYTISLVRTGNSNCGGSQTTIATTSTSGGTGTVGGTSAAPTTPGTYFYCAEHPNQTIGADAFTWSAQNSTAVTITVSATAATTTTITSSLNPSTYGTSVTFTATVTRSSGSNTPTGTVAIKDGANTICTTGNLSGSGGTATASCAVSNLSATGSPHSITAVYGGDSNFNASTSSALSQTVTQKTLTVTGITASNKLYDSTTTATLKTTSAALVGVVSGDTVTLSTAGATGTFSDKSVGTGKTVTVAGLSISGLSSSNYTLTQPTTTADITAKNLTITGVTATNKIYDRTTTATLSGTAALSGIVPGDTATLNSGSVTASFGDKNVGTAKPVTVTGYTISGADAGNYTVSQPTGLTADITAKNLTIAGAIANSKVYDRTTTATLNFGSANLVGVISPDAVTINSSAAVGTFSDKNVGTAKPVSVTGVTLGGADAGNYTVSQPTGLAADITAKNLTITGAAANSKVYDRTTTATLNFGSASLVGVISPDAVTIDSSAAVGTFADKNVGTAKPVSVTGVTLGGTDAGNYTVSQPTGLTADITAKNLTIAGAAANSKVYDRTATATLNFGSASLVGVISPDAVTIDSSAVVGTFADKNVGTAKPVSVTGVTLGGADASNYTVSQPTGLVADITLATVTGSFTAAGKVYDGSNAAAITNRSLAGVIAPDVVTLSGGTATFADKNAANGKTVTGTGFTLSGADAGNYQLASTTLTTTANITPRPLTVSAAGVNKVYDGTASATVTLSDNRIAGDVFTDNYASASFGDKNVGNAKPVSVSGISIFGTDAANYALQNTTASATANITPRPLTVSATGVDRQYDSTTTATVMLSDNRITGDVLTDSFTTASFTNKNVANGKIISVSGISISGTDSGNYSLSNTTSSTTASITPQPLTVSATGVNKIYDGATGATVTLSDDRIAGDVFTDSYTTASFTNKNVGTAKPVTVTGISISGTDAGNYTFNATASAAADIMPKPLNLYAAGVDKVYDGTTTATVTLSDNRVSGDVLTDSYSGASFGNKNVGNAKTVSVSGISISGTDAGNYALQNTTANTTANITRRPLTVSAAGVNKQYEGNATATVTLSDDRVAGDAVTDSFTTASFTNKNVGNGKTVSVSGISISGTDSGNYSLSNTTASTMANITPKPLTVTATGVNKVYDGATGATVTLADDRIAGDVFTNSYTSATFVDKNAGTAKPISVSGISITGVDTANYTFNTTATATADITTRPLTVSATGVNKVYDGNATATVTLSDNRVASDVFTDNYASATFADKNVGNGKTISVSGISISGADAGNYALSNITASATATITPRPLTMTATGINKQYDGNTTTTVTLSDDRVAGDAVTDAYTSAGFADKNVGNGKAVSVSGITIGGTDSGNYALSNTTASTTADIAPRPLVINATGVNKVYDGTITATVNLSDNRLAGDVFTDSYTSASFVDKNVGTAKPVSVSGASISGADAGNYTFNTTASTSADITALHVTLRAATDGKTYDGNANSSAIPTITYGTLASGDTANFSQAFDTKHAGTGKTLTPTGNVNDGNGGNNYLVTFHSVSTGTITPRTLVVTASGVNKIYDGTTVATVTLSDDRLSGDAFTGSYAAANFANKNVGMAKAISVTGISLSGADAGDYSPNTTASATADISKRALTVSATGVNKIYDGDTTATVTLSDDRVAGDTFTGAYTSASFFDKSVGNGKTVTVTGISVSGPDAVNYTFNNTASTTADIIPLGITGNVSAANKLYDGTTAAAITARTLSGALSGDNVGYVGGTATFADRNAGNGKMVTATGLGLGGTDAGNYTVNSTATTTANITPAPLTIQADNKTKAYGQAVPMFTATYTGLVSADNSSSLSGSLLCTTTANALSPVSGSPYPISCSGQNSTNYTIAYLPGTLAVTQATSSVLVTASANPSTLNASVKFTATVSPQFSGVPTGTVTFKDGSTTIGTGVLDSTGHATFTTSTLTPNAHTINAVYGGDGNFTGASGSMTQTVQYASGGMCAGDVGHLIRQPINSDGTSVFKQKSTVPAKFAVCDTNGVSIGTPGVISNFRLTGQGVGTVVNTVDETVDSTTPDTAFRWDPTGQQWIFNLNTKNLNANMTYYYTITLNDGSAITFMFGLK